jgi:diaminopimelate epimerase
MQAETVQPACPVNQALPPLLKMNGIGNEIDVLDLRGHDLTITPDDARAIHADRRTAFDQLMVIHEPRSPGTLGYVQIYNNDGSESGACGNGMRCVAWLVMRDRHDDVVQLETTAGVLECRRIDALTFRVDMGEPRLAWNEIPLRDRHDDTRSIDLAYGPAEKPIVAAPSVVNMGNPHAVFWVDDVWRFDLARIGPALEHDAIFPEKANISLADVRSRDHIALRVWERGVGITKACGSAACAAVVAAVRKDLTDRVVRVTLPGGDLVIDWRASNNHVLMTGPVELELETTFRPRLEGAPA